MSRSGLPSAAPIEAAYTVLDDVELKPGDIFLTRGSSFVSRCIRLFSRGMCESRTRVNHVGLVIKPGRLQNVEVVEATYEVTEHMLWCGYAPPKKTRVAVYRPTNMTPEEIEQVVAAARSQVFRPYGRFAIAMHLLDWFFNHAYLFRRLIADGRYPICSWLVAWAFEQAGRDFRVKSGYAQPDDIDDFVRSNPDKYVEVRALGPIARENRTRQNLARELAAAKSTPTKTG